MPSRTRNPIENSLRVGSNRKLKSISPEELLGLVADRAESTDKVHGGRRPGAGPAARPGAGLARGRVGQLRDRRERCAGHGEPPAGHRGCARPGRRPEERQVADVALHGTSGRLGPGHELAFGALAALGGERRRDVRKRPGMRGEVGQAGCPCPGRGRQDVAGSVRQLEGLVELPPGERLAPAVVADPARRVAGQGQRVADPGERRRDRERLIDHEPARVRQRDEVAGEVAAVDRRDVRGLEPVEVARVVPVVEVPPEALQARDRRERLLEPVDHLQRPDPPEVAGGDGCQEVHPDVRRRRPVRHGGARVVLVVVGRKPVVLAIDERLEEPPGPAGGQAQRRDVGGCELLRGRLGGRHADPPRDQRGGQPEDDERRRDRARLGLQREDEDRDRRPDRHAAGHLPVERGGVEGAACLRLGGGRPFQEVSPRHVQAGEGPPDGVEHEPGLVRQEREAQPDVRRGEAEIGADRPRVAPLGDALPLRQQAPDDGERRRDEHGRQDEPGPCQGRDRRQRPGGDEHGQRERGRQGPAQVVDHLPAGDAGDRAPGSAARGVARPAEDPGQELPVAARPSVLAGRGDEVVRRELVEELDVGHEAGPREDALEQVVAQERVLGDAVRHRGRERVEVVDRPSR